ncbi:PREDICTED: endoplasmic reticulum membrane-associated RNA degradation protein [Gekko japonicus]|uniref:Endoplasmic reticulum membrane-associated RNA degradation protein n=1 Tax=Gekko japonicus TaxID=146911 RepID=A0ABM1KAZ9_GEKJA|nr:PREDICTED: endoplasmic reticulum membrane-associated RNA degradation protein [Gekko japonicus]
MKKNAFTHGELPNRNEKIAYRHILDCDSVTTCLSSTVHYMVCELGFEKEANYAVNSFLTSSGEINWKTIIEHIHYSKTGCDSRGGGGRHIYVFQVAAVAIRVFLLIGKDCPFLLRDLLASWELSTIFGQSVMDVLRVFIGSPDGLNLRNILWHGFASPQEIPTKYSSMLVLLTVGLGQLLSNYLLQTQSDLVHRPYGLFTNLKELHVFPDLSHELLSLAEELVVKSSIVLRTMRPFWITALTLFRQHRYADCVMLLLPQLESGLRLLFTTVNKCPSRLITAESSSLYTTFDEEFLWDFLNHQEGPRIRDHLSHGEISLNNFPKEIANSLLSFSVTLLDRFSKDKIAAIKEYASLRPLVSCANSYCSQFHPIALLKKQVLQCVESINLWSDLPVVPNEQEMTGTLKKDKIFFAFRLMIELLSKPVRILFCPRSVLEVTVVLRQIDLQCHQVSCQVISTCEARYKQWINKSLRSRQRQNYLRLKRSIKCLSPVLQLILILITLELINIHTVCDKNPTEYQQYLKFLKMILQYTENLVTYTNPEKNKWEETLELTHKTLIKIRAFLEKQQMLMQLAK